MQENVPAPTFPVLEPTHFEAPDDELIEQTPQEETSAKLLTQDVEAQTVRIKKHLLLYAQ